MRYMRSNLTDNFGILELQEIILSIMVYIDELCSKYDIDYCLMAGSALGAERHNGFIPWDDDIDIYMTNENYVKFKKNFLLHGNKEKYYLQEWGKTTYHNQNMITMAKIRLNKTTINEKMYNNWDMHQGIFVDIFILHKTSTKLIQQKIQYFWSEAVVLKGLETRGYSAKNMKDKLMLSISKVFPKYWILKHGLYAAYRYDFNNMKNEKFYHGFIDTRKFSRAIFSYDIIFPTKYVKFENVKLKVPLNNKEYLKRQFGENYMVSPPIDSVIMNKHIINWEDNCEIIYSKFSDEKKLI